MGKKFTRKGIKYELDNNEITVVGLKKKDIIDLIIPISIPSFSCFLYYIIPQNHPNVNTKHILTTISLLKILMETEKPILWTSLEYCLIIGGTSRMDAV